MIETIEILLLIMVANGAPILISYAFFHRASLPIDSGKVLADGNPLFGAAKTWRGIIASVIVTMLVSVYIGKGMIPGFVIAVLAMTGDLVSSFIKRRQGKEASSRAFLLDQIPESFLPVLGGLYFWSVNLIHIIVIVVSFIILEILLSKALYLIGVRKKPY